MSEVFASKLTHRFWVYPAIEVKTRQDRPDDANCHTAFAAVVTSDVSYRDCVDRDISSQRKNIAAAFTHPAL